MAYGLEKVGLIHYFSERQRVVADQELKQEALPLSRTKWQFRVASVDQAAIMGSCLSLPHYSTWLGCEATLANKLLYRMDRYCINAWAGVEGMDFNRETAVSMNILCSMNLTIGGYNWNTSIILFPVSHANQREKESASENNNCGFSSLFLYEDIDIGMPVFKPHLSDENMWMNCWFPHSHK